MRKFLRALPMKVWLLLLAVIAFAFFSNDFGLVDIQKTAIILAAGIDKTEDGFALTAQIAVPKGSDRTTGGTSSVEIRGEGKTVSDCVTAIFAETGWVPKLVFCNLIVLGEEAAKEDIVTHLNYFLRNDYMPDSCLLAACAGRAEEVISSTSAIDDTSSLAIEKLFSDAAVKSGQAVTNTLKDFAIGYYGVSKSGYLPFIRMSGQQAGRDDNAISGESEDERETETQKVYSAKETALFSEGKMVGLLSPEETFAFSLLKGKVFAGTFGAEDGEKPVTLTVVKNRGDVSLKGNKAELSLSVTVRLCCRAVTAPIEDVASDSVTEGIAKSAKETLTGYAEKLFASCKECGCDLFFLKRSLYRASLKRYAAEKEGFLERLEPSFRIDVRSMR